MKGGIGSASFRIGDVIVGAISVVNAVGDVVDERGAIIAGAQQEGSFFGPENRLQSLNNPQLLARNTNTTLVVVASNARLNKVDTYRVAQRAHDGMARAIVPCHTTFDGDASIALRTGEVTAPIDLVAEMGAAATAEAIRNGVVHARERGGVRGVRK